MFAAPQASDDDVARETLLAPVTIDDDLGDGRPVGVRLEPDDPRVREQRDVRMLERRPNAEHLGVGLGVDEAREPVARRTADARAERMFVSSSMIPHGAWNGR